MFYGYVRKSVEGNTELSLDVQEEFLRKQARELGQTEVEIVREIGSGASLDSRPRFKELIEISKSGDIIGVYDSSRFSRNTEDALRVASLLQIKGVRIHVAGKFIDIDSPIDKMLWTIQAGFDSYQREIQNKKSKEGLYKQFETGYAVFNGVLCGYEVTRKGKNVIVNPLEDEAKLIQYIFKSYARGKSTYELGAELFGSPTKRGHVFDADKVRRILVNPIYIGKYPAFRGKSRKLTRYTRDQIEPQLIKSNLYPPIIDEDTFWSCWDRYRNVKQKCAIPWSMRFTVHELSGVMHCFECGKPISHFNRNEGTMVRSNYCMHSHLPSCKTHYMTLWEDWWLEDLFRLMFNITFMSGDEVGCFFSERQNQLYEDSKEIKKAIDDIVRSNYQVQNKIDRVIDAISDGLISKTEASKRLETLRSEQKAYEDRKKSLEEDLNRIEVDIDSFIELSSEDIIDRFPNNRRDFYKRFIKSAINYGDRFEVVFMNGKKFTVPKPFCHYHVVDKITVTVSYTDDTYQFIFDKDGPVLVRSGVEVYDKYIQELLDKAWNLVSDKETDSECI